MTEKFFVLDDKVYWFDRIAFAKAWLRDRRLSQRIGISRQAAHLYCRGALSPKRDRAVLLREVCPKALVLVGPMPKGDTVGVEV